MKTINVQLRWLTTAPTAESIEQRSETVAWSHSGELVSVSPLTTGTDSGLTYWDATATVAVQ
jgi:hypothetical protein